MPERVRSWPFLELLAMELKGTWRFPLPEVFVFLYAFLALMFGHMVRAAATLVAEEARLLLVINASSGMVGFITMILILKNIAYGLANEIRKGLVQTYLTYPIGRGRFLAIKVISGILVPVGMAAGSVVVFTALILPELALKHLDVFAMSLLGLVAGSLLSAALMLLSAVTVRRGGVSLAVSIGIIFAIQIASSILLMAASISGEEALWRAYYVLNPLYALMQHYRLAGLAPGAEVYRPELWECYAYMAGYYAIVLALYLLTFIYFLRRFEPT